MALPIVDAWANDSTMVPHAISVSPRHAVDLEIVVPAYNEERRIGATLAAIRGYLARQPYSSAVVVVDNGSVDRTADAVAELQGPAVVPVHLMNCARRGKGAAVRRGVLSSTANRVGFCDADLATPIETLREAWPLLEEGAPIVIGSRRRPGARYVHNQPLPRRLGGWGFRLMAGLLVPEISDTQCGFKLFQRSVARELFTASREDGFAFDVELLAIAQSAGLPILEVPVNWSDQPGSSFRALRDGFSSAFALVSVAWRLQQNGQHRREPAGRGAEA